MLYICVGVLVVSFVIGGLRAKLAKRRMAEMRAYLDLSVQTLSTESKVWAINRCNELIALQQQGKLGEEGTPLLEELSRAYWAGVTEHAKETLGCVRLFGLVPTKSPLAEVQRRRRQQGQIERHMQKEPTK